MTTLLLVRHGETDWNAERRWQGHADVPMNKRGREQARALADQLALDRIDAIYASDLGRARETAEIVAERIGVPVIVDPDLREIDVGAVEGMTWEESEALRSDVGWPGEPKDEHAARVLGALARIAEAHPDARVLVVTHGGSMRRVHEHLGLEHSGPFENCALWMCAHEDGRVRAID